VETSALPDTWLSLHAASELLGLAPSTLRRWADAGRIPMRRTAGGHRRFNVAAMRGLMPEGAPAPAQPEIAGFQPSAASGQAWHAQLSHGATAIEMRGLGQRLLGLLIQYLVWHGDGSRFLADGRAVGQRYGAAARGGGVTLRETIEAFLYFRRTFWSMALQMPAMTNAADAAEAIRLAERIDHFMNEVLLSTIAGYETPPAPEDPPWTVE
jgi:excisionase family DNA binding protein